MARYEEWTPPPRVEPFSEAEELFTELLDRAIRTPETMRSFFDTERPPIADEEEPLHTLRMLEISARRDFLSGVLLLGSNVLSWGVERHVLPILESMAYTAYILGQVPDATLDDAAARATCVELGRLIAQRDAWRGSRATTETIGRLEEAVERARQRHTDAGCTCAGRDASTVQATLQALTQGADAALAALPDVWAVLRAGAAGDGDERLFPPLDGDDLAHAPYRHRSLMLASLLNGYGIPAAWLLSLDHASHADMTSHVTSKLLESVEMQAGLNGDLDAGKIPERVRAED